MNIARNFLLCLLVAFLSIGISSAQEHANPSFKRGYAALAEAGTMINHGYNGGYVSISSGYNVLPGLFSGIGIGAKNQQFYSGGEPKSLLVPVFLQLRYSPLNRPFSPFVDVKGGLLMDYTSAVKTVPANYQDNTCGHFFKASIGLDYKRYSISFGDDWGALKGHSGYAWTFGLGYKF